MRAALGDAFDNGCGIFQHQLACGEIIQEKQRLGPLAHQIIHAHCHQIDADGLKISGIDGDAQLGAHTIGGGHQNRVGVARILEIKQRAKAAQARHHAGARSAFCGRLDPLDQRIACVNINARLGVGDAVFAIRHDGPLFCLRAAYRMGAEFAIGKRGSPQQRRQMRSKA